MTIVIIYFVLWLTLMVTIFLSFSLKLPASTIVGQLGGFVGLTAALLQNFAKHNLSVYFWLQRIRLALNAGAVTRWRFSARFTGTITEGTLNEVIAFLCDPKLFAMPVSIESRNNRQATIVVDETVTLTVSLETAEFSEARRAGAGDGDNLTVISRFLELPYRYSVEKIQRQIVPLLTTLATQLRAIHSSFELDVEFRGKNPFFEVYIAHLKPEQIDDFRVLLHVDSTSPLRKDRIEIASRHVHIMATSTDSFSRLASDFIVLSPDVKILVGAKPHA